MNVVIAVLVLPLSCSYTKNMLFNIMHAVLGLQIRFYVPDISIKYLRENQYQSIRSKPLHIIRPVSKEVQAIFWSFFSTINWLLYCLYVVKPFYGSLKHDVLLQFWTSVECLVRKLTWVGWRLSLLLMPINCKLLLAHTEFISQS